MNKHRGIATYLVTFMIANLLASSLFAATQPKFVLTPLTPTTLSVEFNETQTVQYQISNSTKITRTLTMIPIQGIQQITSTAGSCTNPFTLAQNQSCVLNLSFAGNALPGNVTTGPEICATNGEGDNTPDPFLCSQPTLANSLNITVLPLASITFVGDSALTLTANGTSTGTLSIQNISGRTIPPGVTAHFEGTALNDIVTATTCGEILNNQTCTITFTAKLTNIKSTTFPIYGSNTIPLEGSITINASPVAYLTRDSNTANEIYQCIIDADSGNFVNCETFSNLGLNAPHGIVVNPAKTRAYILNFGNNSVTQCAIDPNTLHLINCESALANGLASLHNFTINPAGTIAYIPDSNGDKINKCPINPTTGKFDNSCSDSGATLVDGPKGIVIDPNNHFAYIANSAGHNITRCSVDQSTANLLECSPVYTQEKSEPIVAIAMNTAGTMLYMISDASAYPSEQIVCPINFIGCIATPFSSTDSSLSTSIAINDTGTTNYTNNDQNSNYQYTQFTLVNGFISSHQSYSTLPANPWGIALLE